MNKLISTKKQPQKKTIARLPWALPHVLLSILFMPSAFPMKTETQSLISPNKTANQPIAPYSPISICTPFIAQKQQSYTNSLYKNPDRSFSKTLKSIELPTCQTETKQKTMPKKDSPTEIHPIATDMAIASLYLISSIPAVGPTTQTITDLAGSTLWMADDIKDLKHAEKRTAEQFFDIAIAGLFLASELPCIPEHPRTGAGIGASGIWLATSIKNLFCAPKKKCAHLTELVIAGLYMVGSLPLFSQEVNDDANIAASTLWMACSGISLAHTLKANYHLRALRAKNNAPTALNKLAPKELV